VSVTVLETQTRRQDANGNTPSRTYTAPNQFAITRADCLDDQRFQISLNFNGSPSSTATTLQAWVSQGADCKEVAQRQGSTQQCWPANLGEDPGVNLNKTVTLKVRDILSQLNVTGGFSPTFQAGSEDTCKRVTTPAGGTRVSIYFLLINGTQVSSASNAFQPLVVVTGPGKPRVNAVRGGDGLVFVDLDRGQYTTTTTTTDGGSTTDGGTSTSTSTGNESSLASYVVYCNPVPGKEDPGTASPVVVNDGILTCTAKADAFKEGFIESSSVIDPKWQCAEVASGATTRVQLSGLKNGVGYQVAVAPKDLFGNTGTPSDVFCAVPQEVDDFFETYRKSGGQGGGGYCSVNRVGFSLGAGAGAVGMLALAAYGIRRRRSK
jgi:hypothetical protein